MSNSRIRLHVFDVGHGDSLLLEFPDGKSYGIVDCHRHRQSHRGFGQAYNRDEPKVLTYFRKLIGVGIEPIIEFACLTHPHLDHYRGYGMLLRGIRRLGIPIREYWDFGVSRQKARAIMQLPEVPEFEEHKSEMVDLLRVKEELLDEGADHRILINPTRRIWSKDGVEIDLLAPHAKQFEAYANYLGCQTAQERQKYREQFLKRGCFTDRKRRCRCPTDDHNVSSALLVRCGRARLLLASDISDCAWRGILLKRYDIDPSCHCVKVSHHGSMVGNRPYDRRSLWRAIKEPEGRLVALISGGYRIALPHKEIVGDLQQAGCDIYCTGPQVPTTHEGYVVDAISDPLAVFALETICFRDSEDDAVSPDDSTAAGDGNIIVECCADGSCEVHTEFDRSTYTPVS